MRRPNARGRAAQAPAAYVAQLEHALAAEQRDRPAAGQRRAIARRPGGRRQPFDGRRAAARERGHRHQQPRA
jgi:hypothetical protein